jgi:hypothetical protein
VYWHNIRYKNISEDSNEIAKDKYNFIFNRITVGADDDDIDGV